MIEIVKKSMLAGIGIASLTKDKVEEIAKDLVKQGGITEQEGRKFVEEMLGYADKTRNDMEKIVESSIEKVINRLDLVRRKDFDEVKKSLDEIQEKLDAGK